MIVASRSTTTGPVPVCRARRCLLAPTPLPGRRPRRPDRPQAPRQVALSGRDQPCDYRVRGARGAQLRLLPQHRDIGYAVLADSDRGGQVRDDLPRAVGRPRHTPPIRQTDRPARPAIRIVSSRSTTPDEFPGQDQWT